MTDSTTRVAFVGLGVMGGPMAGHLADAGHEVHVFNRSVEKSVGWLAEHAGVVADSAAEAARDARIVFLCLGDDDSVRDMVLGEGAVLASMAPGSVLVDHTTASATLARELATAAADAGVGFVDAPVSGGQAGAENGTLTIMAGGLREHYRKVDAVWDCYARKATRIGGPGTGQLAKMVNQICIAGLLQGLSEGLAFLDACGLDGERVIDAISGGAAQSWQMDNRAATMLSGEFDFGFAVDWMRKDLRMALAEADRHGLDLPVAKLVDEFYARVQQNGGGRFDTSSLITLLRDA